MIEEFVKRIPKSLMNKSGSVFYSGPGFPLLEVPDEDILARGTTDPLADVATQARLSARVGSQSPPTRH